MTHYPARPGGTPALVSSSLPGAAGRPRRLRIWRNSGRVTSSVAAVRRDVNGAGVDDVLSDVAQFAVGVLARDPKQVESLLPGELVLGHENADCRPDVPV